VGKNIMKSLMICTFTQYFVGDKIENNEMGEACSAYGREDRRIQDSGGKT
jgi:hypothetical protein